MSPLLQCEDGAAVDGRRRFQDLLLRDERKPVSVLGLRVGSDRNRCGHPAAGPSLRPGHTGQAGLNVFPRAVKRKIQFFIFFRKIRIYSNYGRHQEHNRR